MLQKIVSGIVKAFVYACAICFLAGLSAVPIALALKFIIWLF